MAIHFTVSERQQLAALVALRVSKIAIARRLQRAPSTIFRELKRNCGDTGYQAGSAQQQAVMRHTHRHRKMDSPEVAEYVKSRLELRWSPDQIDGRTRRDFLDDRLRRISRQTIYNWLKQPAGSEHRQYLRFYREKPPLRRRVDPAQTLPNRPAIIGRRERFGDWEGDTLVGRKGISKPVLYSIVERVSGYLELARGENREADTANRILRRRLNQYPPNWLQSCTFDNGAEFAKVGELESVLQIEVYHTQPYKAWQRGTNENTNGLIRQYFPKGTDFQQVSQAELTTAESQLNTRPRKRLGYQTPQELKNKYC
ncbi:IS30 family transposase [Anatilimnocola floriformis]|uniref:IS30 family transposase n=1 Tax=Anatilimnocola floriformis TaxID=2948575 RepID=UPI0020C55AE7|nr:IS30 family transposase [Anatilimnocola floriformis]